MVVSAAVSLSPSAIFAAPPAPVFPPVGSNVAEQALLQNRIEKLAVRLDAKTWRKRAGVRRELLSVLSKNPQALRFFLLLTRSSKEPEIRFQGKRVLKSYFEKHVYDPKRKMGFIGISLSVGGFYNFEGVSYVPIRVVFAQKDYPGEKAGIKACDLILEVDGKKCSRDFSVEKFVSYISSKSPGDVVSLSMLSRGRKVVRKVVLTKRPENSETPSIRKSESEMFEAWLEHLRGTAPNFK